MKRIQQLDTFSLDIDNILHRKIIKFQTEEKGFTRTLKQFINHSKFCSEVHIKFNDQLSVQRNFKVKFSCTKDVILDCICFQVTNFYHSFTNSIHYGEKHEKNTCKLRWCCALGTCSKTKYSHKQDNYESRIKFSAKRISIAQSDNLQKMQRLNYHSLRGKKNETWGNLKMQGRV